MCTYNPDNNDLRKHHEFLKTAWERLVDLCRWVDNHPAGKLLLEFILKFILWWLSKK